MIEINNLTKSFAVGKGKNKSSVTPLRDVTMTVPDGKIIGLSGESGAGKSTLANILCGILRPSEGQIFVDGKRLYDEKGRYVKKTGARICLIPQQPHSSLDPMQRVGDAVKEALVASKTARRGKDAKEKMLMLFDYVGLERVLAARLPSQLSGGQAQRVVIARALATHPTTLISDESTSMLDASTQNNVISLFEKLVSERGISLIFISHDMGIVSGVCDGIYVIENGMISKIRGKS